jgi:predicted nucleic acid-binding Zn ribbon protein
MSSKKFCPRCGTANNASDAYCVKCRYDFRRKGKNSSLKTIIILLIVLLVAWIIYRIFTGKPIIPTGLLDLIKNMTTTK